MSDKKQIVFIEPKPTVYVFRMAMGLKSIGYETILISLSKIDKEFYSNAYDKTLVLELSHKLDRKFLKTLIDFFKKTLGKNGRNFFKRIKKMEPYMFQVTGPDLFTLMMLFFLKKSPKTYYANDIWSIDKRIFLFTKKYCVKGELQKLFEKICFKKVDGILNKTSLKELELLNYKVNVPKMAISLSCLEKWVFSPKKKKNREMHIVYAASPPRVTWKGEVPFIQIMKIITSQKIHLHTYGNCMTEKNTQIYIKESKKNKYYHFHEKVTPYELNKEMSKYDYGIIPYFLAKPDLIAPEEAKAFLAAKVTNYLEAGLPIIVGKLTEHMAKIINKHNVGFTINFGDLKNLRKIIEQKDYSQLQKNIKKFQEKFSSSKQIKEIESFYNKIIDVKKSNLS